MLESYRAEYMSLVVARASALYRYSKLVSKLCRRRATLHVNRDQCTCTCVAIVYGAHVPDQPCLFIIQLYFSHSLQTYAWYFPRLQQGSQFDLYVSTCVCAELSNVILNRFCFRFSIV